MAQLRLVVGSVHYSDLHSLQTAEKGVGEMTKYNQYQKHVDQMCLDYQKGASIREIAAEYGYSYSGMNRVLKRSGIVFRSRGGNNMSKKAGFYNRYPKAPANG